MRAAWYSRNGAAREVLTVGELPTPEPGPGELRVRLATSGVNPSDVTSRQGRPLGGDLIVPHSDGAGVVDAVGEGVEAARMGRRVWVWNGQWQRPLGTAAEFIVLPATQAVPLPDRADFAGGACLGIPAMTAWHAVQRCGELRGRTLLVIGAASAVGHYAAQLAVAAGACVLGTAGSPAKAAHARAAGVETVIDYKREPVTQRVKDLTGGRGVDAVIDMDFSTTADWLAEGLVAPHGVLVGYGSNVYTDIVIPFRQLLFASLSLHFFLVYDLAPADRQAAVDGLTRLLGEGRLVHAIGGRWPLADIAAAHEAVEGGALIGNVVVDING
jgi:NADPH:quinone reductase